MQHSSASNLPSLSSTNPFSGDEEAQKAHDAASPSADATYRSAKSGLNISKRASSQKAASAAKLQIRSKLREDWEWPNAEQLQPLVELNLPHSDSAWRERESDSSLTVHTDPYRYESPDTVAEPVKLKRQKRHHQVQDEATWNDGLKVFMERRNAWTGAQLRATEADGQSLLKDDIPTPSTGQSDGSSGPDITEKSQDSVQNMSPPPSPSTVVPIGPPIISPDNEVRASITTATYSSIYSKIIVQGLTPTIPINLSDVVGAMVQGWKKDGEWPPKTEADQLAALRGKRGDEAYGVRDGSKKLAKKGVGKFKKVLGIGNEGSEESKATETAQV